MAPQYSISSFCEMLSTKAGTLPHGCQWQKIHAHCWRENDVFALIFKKKLSLKMFPVTLYISRRQPKISTSSASWPSLKYQNLSHAGQLRGREMGSEWRVEWMIDYQPRYQLLSFYGGGRNRSTANCYSHLQSA